jgi:hypothetical protein
MIDVSIVIINYNTIHLTKQCIESIVFHTKLVSYEIILVDNGSSEEGVEQLSNLYANLTLIRNVENLGFSKANNIGIKHAKGKYVLLLNSDTYFCDDSISKSVIKLSTETDIGVLSCKLEFPNGQIQHQCRRFETLTLYLVEFLRLHKLMPKRLKSTLLLNGYFDHETEMVVDRVWGTFFLFKKDLLSLLPEQKWAETFFMYGEDNEWCYQIRTYTPYKILYYPDAHVIHIMGGSKFGTGESVQKNKIILQNKHIYMEKYYGKRKTSLYFKFRNWKTI